MYHATYPNIRILDRGIGTDAIAAFKAVKGLTDVVKESIYYSIVVTGSMFIVPVKKHLKRAYGQAFTFLGVFSSRFILNGER